MTAKHTKGPWGIIKGRAESVIFSGDKGAMIAQIICAVSSVEHHANARLIAAAPDLLEALEAAVLDKESPGQWLDEARAAIAKATGETK